MASSETIIKLSLSPEFLGLFEQFCGHLIEAGEDGLLSSDQAAHLASEWVDWNIGKHIVYS